MTCFTNAVDSFNVFNRYTYIIYLELKTKLKGFLEQSNQLKLKRTKWKVITELLRLGQYSLLQSSRLQIILLGYGNIQFSLLCFVVVTRHWADISSIK